MATTLILSLAITLALAVLLVPAIGTVVFAQNMSGGIAGQLGNMTQEAANETKNMTEKAGGMLANMTGK